MADQEMEFDDVNNGEELELGSRPADGAKQALPSEIYGEEWNGEDGAADFLGLGSDVESDDWTPVDPNDDADPGVGDQAYPATGAGLEMAEPVSDFGGPGVAPTAAAGYGSANHAAAAAPIEAGASQAAWGAETVAGDAFDGYAEEEEFEAPAKGRSFATLALLGLVAAAGGGGVFALDYYGIAPLGLFPDKQEIASVEPSDPTPSAVAANADSDTPSETTDSVAAAVSGAVVQADPEDAPTAEPAVNPNAENTEAGDDTAELAAEVPTEEPEPNEQVAVASSEPAEQILSSNTLTPETLEVASETIDIGTDAVEPQTLSVESDAVASTGFVDIHPSDVAKFDVIWRSPDVPIKMIHAGAKMLTPSVGAVRVLSVSGDVFEGNLKAVGQKRVWLGMAGGEMTLEGDTIEQIERIPQIGGTAKQGLASAGAGKRVKATTSGGAFYGRVQSQHGSRLTLLLDSGARVTLYDPLIESITERSRVKFKSF